MDSITVGESDDMAGVGAIKLEQRRIESEIRAQEERLKQLQESAEPTLADELKPLWRIERMFISVPFKWGMHEWNGQMYQFAHSNPPPQIGIHHYSS